VEEVGSSEVGLSEKVVLVFLAAEAGAVKKGSGFLLSKRVLSRWVLGQGGCGFLEQVKGASTSLRVQNLFMAVVAGKAVTGACVLGLSVPRGQVWVRGGP
jgi:hypothetical protein